MALFESSALYVAEIFGHCPALYVVLANFGFKIPRYVSLDVRLPEIDMNVKRLKGLKLCD